MCLTNPLKTNSSRAAYNQTEQDSVIQPTSLENESQNRVPLQGLNSIFTFPPKRVIFHGSGSFQIVITYLHLKTIQVSYTIIFLSCNAFTNLDAITSFEPVAFSKSRSRLDLATLSSVQRSEKLCCILLSTLGMASAIAVLKERSHTSSVCAHFNLQMYAVCSLYNVRINAGLGTINELFLWASVFQCNRRSLQNNFSHFNGVFFNILYM